jgi:hypothetical protein
MIRARRCLEEFYGLNVGIHGPWDRVAVLGHGTPFYCCLMSLSQRSCGALCLGRGQWATLPRNRNRDV